MLIFLYACVSGARASGAGEETPAGTRETVGKTERAGEAEGGGETQRDREERGKQTITRLEMFLLFKRNLLASIQPNCFARANLAIVQAAKRELERQRQLEWERQRRQELLTQRNREQESIVLLKARKKTLEFELEALVSKHQQTQT